jgi:hypothetical protein
MSGSNLTAAVVPTGGAVLLQMSGYVAPTVTGMMSLTRAVQGTSGPGPFTTLYTGPLLAAWLDTGDALPAPLTAANGYVYQLSEVNTLGQTTSTVQVGPLYPASAMASAPDGMTQILIRLLQGGMNNLALPPGIALPQVTSVMPQGGWQSLPLIVLNLELIQQEQTQIGEDVMQPDVSNTWEIPCITKRMWRVTVLSKNATERDFFRDSLIAMFRVLKATVFAQLGQDVTHDFQAVSGTDVNEWEGKTPGFFYSDILMSLSGVSDTVVMTGYGIIKSFSVDITINQPS